MSTTLIRFLVGRFHACNLVQMVNHTRIMFTVVMFELVTKRNELDTSVIAILNIISRFSARTSLLQDVFLIVILVLHVSLYVVISKTYRTYNKFAICLYRFQC